MGKRSYGTFTIISVVLLLVVAVFSGIAIYPWLMNFLSETGIKSAYAPSKIVVIESVKAVQGGFILYVRNVGVSPVTVDRAYIELLGNGSLEEIVLSPTTLRAGELKEIAVPYYNVERGKCYRIKLTTTSGSIFSMIYEVLEISEYRWLLGWSYRKPHEIVGSTAGSVTNYQIKFIVHFGAGSDVGASVYLNGKCKSDFSDVRFTLSDGVTELPYWIEEKVDGDYAVFWVMIPSIPAYPDKTLIYVYYGNPSAKSNSDKESTFPYFMEVKRITLPRQTYAGQWFSFSFDNEFQAPPIVIAEPDQTFNEIRELRIRLKDITRTSFMIRQQEPSNRDDIHASEDVTYIAVPPGSWKTVVGEVKLEAGIFQTDKWLAGDGNVANDRWNTVNFSYNFSSPPIVLSQIQDFSYTGCAHTRIRNVDVSGFQTSPEPEGSVTTPPTTVVTVGWLAVEQHVSKLDGSTKSEAQVVNNVRHWWKTFHFGQSYSQEPNIVAWMQTYNGGDAAGLRGNNLSPTSFSVRVEEDLTYDWWDINHAYEDIGYFAVEYDGKYHLRKFIDPEPSHGSWGLEETFS